MRFLFALFAILLSVGISHAQSVSVPASVGAGMGTPSANNVVCSNGLASISSGSLYLQRDAVGNGIWKCVLGTDGVTYTWLAPANNLGILSSTASIGGALLALGGTVSGTATVTGASVGANCLATPSDGTAVLGVTTYCNVASPGVATVTLQATIAGTPAAKTYNVRVIQ